MKLGVGEERLEKIGEESAFLILSNRLVEAERKRETDPVPPELSLERESSIDWGVSGPMMVNLEPFFFLY